MGVSPKRGLMKCYTTFFTSPLRFFLLAFLSGLILDAGIPAIAIERNANNSVTAKDIPPNPYSTGEQVGLASWYSITNSSMANGAKLNSQALTVAHRTHPFGTSLRVTTCDGKRKVIVKVTDRGPFMSRRIVDLSPAAFKKLAPLSAGVICVKVRKL